MPLGDASVTPHFICYRVQPIGDGQPKQPAVPRDGRRRHRRNDSAPIIYSDVGAVIGQEGSVRQ